jgi:Ca2+/Na+ antiporter
MGKRWLSGLVISIAAMLLFQTVFSYWAQVGVWGGLGVFLICLVAFFVVIIRLSGSKRSDAEQEAYANWKREQADNPNECD